MSNIPIKYQPEVDALIAQAVDAAIAELKAKNDAEIASLVAAKDADIAALNVLLEKAREQNATADYSAYADFPDLIELLKKTDLRPGALPSLCALHVWRGLKMASDISKAIPVTPKLGDKGGVPSTPKMITASLQKLEKSLIAANTGVGVKVTSIRGKEGNSSVKRITFTPMVFEDEPSDDVTATDAPSETVIPAETVGATEDTPAMQQAAE